MDSALCIRGPQPPLHASFSANAAIRTRSGERPQCHAHHPPDENRQALLFPHKAGLPYRNGLKMLMRTHLNRHIQMVEEGKMHGQDSMEDANAAGELVRFALAKEWSRLKRDGWSFEDGVLKAPLPRGGRRVRRLPLRGVEG